MDQPIMIIDRRDLEQGMYAAAVRLRGVDAPRGGGRKGFTGRGFCLSRPVDLDGDPGQQLRGMVGFGEELADVQGFQSLEVAVEDRGAADDDRLPWLLELDPAADLDSGIDGEVQVEQDHVEGT